MNVKLGSWPSPLLSLSLSFFFCTLGTQSVVYGDTVINVLTAHSRPGREGLVRL